MIEIQMMKWRCQAWLLGAWLVISLMQAQGTPSAPANGVHDDTRALSATAKEALAQDIAACRQAIGADVWFTAGTFLPSGQTLRLHARTLRQEWSPGRDAVLLAYDRASDSHAISFSPGIWERYPSAQLVTLVQNSMVTMSDKAQTLEARLTVTVHKALQKLQRLEKQRHRAAETLSRHHLRLAQAFGIALATGAFFLAVIGTFIRCRDVQAAWQLFFPSVQVGIRYGAPHGGGVIVTKSVGPDD